MLADPRIDKMAEVIAGYSVKVKPGMQVGIIGTTLAMPLIESLCKHILLLGGVPIPIVQMPNLRDILVTYGSEEQLATTSPVTLMAYEQFEGLVSIQSEQNTRALSNADPAKSSALARASKPIGDWSMRRRVEKRPACGTLFPTAAYAQDAEMSLSDFEDLVFRVCLLDQPDPVAAWRELSAQQQRIVDWLKGKKKLHAEGPQIDLRMSIEGRVFINSDGTTGNFPSGEVFTSPVEDSVEGQIYFSYPASYAGRSVSGIKLRFQQGKIVEHSAETGEDFLTRMLDIDAGSRTMGEFAIGTNPGITRPTRNILFDEKISGTIHCAIGQSYEICGGVNKSTIHWDIITDMRQGRITVDGETLYENGAFVI